MDRKHNQNNIMNARALRKAMTKEERHLWYDFLQSYPVKFYRQKILGKYIVDFYCSSAKLVIELDGSQHYENSGLKYDAERSAYLEQYDITVIRIANNEVSHNFVGVCEYIDYHVQSGLKKWGKLGNNPSVGFADSSPCTGEP